MSPQQKQQSLKSFRVALCGITLASLSACASTPDTRAREKQMALEIQREKQVSELKQSTVFQERLSQFQSKDCSVLTALIAAPEPPPEFRLLVQLKAAELCDAVPLPEVVPSWANTLFEEVGRDRARRMKLDDEFMDRSLQLAKLWPGRAQRLAALDEARALAIKLGDKARLEAIEVALEKISPARLRRPTLSDAIRQGDDYRLLGQFAQARRAYRRALDSTQTSLADRFKALEGLRWVARLENRTDEVIRVRKEMSRLSETHELKPGLLGDAERERALRQRWLNRQIDTARAYWTDQQAQAARRVLLAAEARLKGRANLLDSMFLRAAIADEARDLREVERVIAEMQLDSLANADQESRAFLAKVAWLHGWALRREAERDHDQRDQLW